MTERHGPLAEAAGVELAMTVLAPRAAGTFGGWYNSLAHRRLPPVNLSQRQFRCLALLFRIYINIA